MSTIELDELPVVGSTGNLRVGSWGVGMVVGFGLFGVGSTGGLVLDEADQFVSASMPRIPAGGLIRPGSAPLSKIDQLRIENKKLQDQVDELTKQLAQKDYIKHLGGRQEGEVTRP